MIIRVIKDSKALNRLKENKNMQSQKEIVAHLRKVALNMRRNTEPMENQAATLIEQQAKRIAELEKDAARYRWITDADRTRYVSVRIDFWPMDQESRVSMYRQHRVCWHDEERGWVDAEGDGLDAAIDAAMNAAPQGASHD